MTSPNFGLFSPGDKKMLIYNHQSPRITDAPPHGSTGVGGTSIVLYLDAPRESEPMKFTMDQVMQCFSCHDEITIEALLAGDPYFKEHTSSYFCERTESEKRQGLKNKKFRCSRCYNLGVGVENIKGSEAKTYLDYGEEAYYWETEPVQQYNPYVQQYIHMGDRLCSTGAMGSGSMGTFGNAVGSAAGAFGPHSHLDHYSWSDPLANIPTYPSGITSGITTSQMSVAAAENLSQRVLTPAEKIALGGGVVGGVHVVGPASVHNTPDLYTSPSKASLHATPPGLTATGLPVKALTYNSHQGAHVVAGVGVHASPQHTVSPRINVPGVHSAATAGIHPAANFVPGASHHHSVSASEKGYHNGEKGYPATFGEKGYSVQKGYSAIEKVYPAGAGAAEKGYAEKGYSVGVPGEKDYAVAEKGGYGKGGYASAAEKGGLSAGYNERGTPHSTPQHYPADRSTPQSVEIHYAGEKVSVQHYKAGAQKGSHYGAASEKGAAAAHYGAEKGAVAHYGVEKAGKKGATTVETWEMGRAYYTSGSHGAGAAAHESTQAAKGYNTSVKAGRGYYEEPETGKSYMKKGYHAESTVATATSGKGWNGTTNINNEHTGRGAHHDDSMTIVPPADHHQKGGNNNYGNQQQGGGNQYGYKNNNSDDQSGGGLYNAHNSHTTNTSNSHQTSNNTISNSSMKGGKGNRNVNHVNHHNNSHNSSSYNNSSYNNWNPNGWQSSSGWGSNNNNNGYYGDGNKYHTSSNGNKYHGNNADKWWWNHFPPYNVHSMWRTNPSHNLKTACGPMKAGETFTPGCSEDTQKAVLAMAQKRIYNQIVANANCLLVDENEDGVKRGSQETHCINPICRGLLPHYSSGIWSCFCTRCLNFFVKKTMECKEARGEVAGQTDEIQSTHDHWWFIYDEIRERIPSFPDPVKTLQKALEDLSLEIAIAQAASSAGEDTTSETSCIKMSEENAVQILRVCFPFLFNVPKRNLVKRMSQNLDDALRKSDDALKKSDDLEIEILKPSSESYVANNQVGTDKVGRNDSMIKSESPDADNSESALNDFISSAPQHDAHGNVVSNKVDDYEDDEHTKDDNTRQEAFGLLGKNSPKKPKDNFLKKSLDNESPPLDNEASSVEIPSNVSSEKNLVEKSLPDVNADDIITFTDVANIVEVAYMDDRVANDPTINCSKLVAEVSTTDTDGERNTDSEQTDMEKHVEKDGTDSNAGTDNGRPAANIDQIRHCIGTITWIGEYLIEVQIVKETDERYDTSIQIENFPNALSATSQSGYIPNELANSVNENNTNNKKGGNKPTSGNKSTGGNNAATNSSANAVVSSGNGNGITNATSAKPVLHRRPLPMTTALALKSQDYHTLGEKVCCDLIPNPMQSQQIPMTLKITHARSSAPPIEAVYSGNFAHRGGGYYN